jgi:DNA-binding SARP family transcriptional activator/tetratricopeptide (TPR) repeat protein
VAVRVRVLGGLVVEGIDLGRLSSRKARRVLARLAIARSTPVAAEALADVVWGDAQPSHPVDQLSVLVSRLRSVLGAERITRGPAGYTLVADWLDVAVLGELATEARRRLDTGATAPATAAARAAIELLRGPVLPEEPPDSEWLEADRAEAARHAATVRLVAAEAALAGGDTWGAADAAQRALDAEPYDEAALRALMLAHERAGRPALALQAYASTAERLADDLGVDPSAETQAVHLRLLRAQPVAEPVAPAALPGRNAELVRLRDLLDRVRDSAVPELVLIEGDAGIGKTRLLAAFTMSVPTGTLVLRCHGDDLAGGLPLQPLLDAIARQASTDLLGGDAAPLAGLLGEPASGATPAVAALASNPEAGLSLVFAAMDTVMRRLAADRSVVLVVDDAQWCDSATRAWLRHATRRLTGTRLLIAAAQRVGEGEPVRAETVLALGPLDPEAAAAMVGLPADSPRALRLYERSGGHPMFLSELSRAADDGELPLSIRDSVAKRCDRAGPAAAATLRAASVLGPDVDLDLLAAVLDEPVRELLDHLEEGVRRHLLVESRSGFQFAHQLVRDAMRSDTGITRTALLHRQAARCLAARSHADPLAVAYHARLGGDLGAAATALATAGEIAARRFDLAEATRLLDEAVALDGRTDLLVRRARIRLRVSDTAGATADTVAVRSQVEPEHADYAAALEVAALVSYVERDFARCGELADQGAALAADPEVRASCRAIAGRVRHAVGDLAGARELLDAPLDSSAPSLTPVVQMWRGLLLVHADEPARALRLVAADEPTQTRVGYPFAAITRHMVAGYAQALRGEPAAALAELDRMAAAARRESTDRFTGRDDNFRGWILRSVGATGEADEANTRAYELSRQHDLSESLAHALLDLADGRLRATDPAGAQSYLDTLAAEGGDGYLFQWRARLRTDLIGGRVALAAEAPDDAVARFEEVLATATQLELHRYQVLARLWLAQARRALPPRRSRVSAESVAADVEALGSVAPLEAWWMTADLARAFDVDGWRRLAVERASALADHAGSYADALRRAAASATDS